VRTKDLVNQKHIFKGGHIAVIPLAVASGFIAGTAPVTEPAGGKGLGRHKALLTITIDAFLPGVVAGICQPAFS